MSTGKSLGFRYAEPVTRRTFVATAALALAPSAVIGVADLVEGSGFARIRAGKFHMGSANGTTDQAPVHTVQITRPFEIGKFEVTQAQWETVMSGAHRDPSKDPIVHEGQIVSPKPSHFDGENRPVESVSWDDIQIFLTRLNARDPSHNYRLPSEAEWEYAARAGRSLNSPGDLDSAAWYEGNADGTTHNVGVKQPNPWGLFDTEGNVAEWVADWFSPNYYAGSPKKDPAGPPTGSYRVYRGGCWFDPAKNCTAALRRYDFPHSRVYNVGFRLVRTGV